MTIFPSHASESKSIKQNNRTGLLVSVRDLEEAQTAVAEGVDILDVKEPRNGPLGAADLEVLEQIADAFADLIPLSAALGELTHCTIPPGDLPGSFTFAKFGLAGAANVDWRQLLRERFAQLSDQVMPVAVIYGDWKTCEAPSPKNIIEFAAEQGCGAILFDTFFKNGRSIFDSLCPAELSELLDHAASVKIKTVIAGGLNQSTLPDAVALEPDFVAVRGAACKQDRESGISAEAIRSIKRGIQSQLSHN